MLRYLRLLGIQLRASTAVAMQYRLDFLVQGGLALFRTSWSLVPILVVFGNRKGVAGWTFEEALVGALALASAAAWRAGIRRFAAYGG